MCKSMLPQLSGNQRNIIKVLLHYSSLAFGLITILAITLPLLPHMPATGLDPSWQLAMNEAVSQKLAIGKDIVFTFGPYASIYTKQYHPEVYMLTLLGGGLLGLSFSVAFGKLTTSWPSDVRLFLLIACLAVFLILRDAIFLFYPLLAALVVVKICSNESFSLDAQLKHLFSFAFILIPFGLLPLVKGNYLIICAVTLIVVELYFLYHRCRILFLAVLIVPASSMAVLWILSGQEMCNLPAYLLSQFPIASGYTEAMSLPGDPKEVTLYIISSIIILLTIFFTPAVSKSDISFIFLCFLLFLFISFKSGFVRHDGHALIAASALPIAAIALGLLWPNNRQWYGIIFAIFICGYIYNNHAPSSFVEMSRRVGVIYTQSWNGIHRQIHDRNSLSHEFQLKIDSFDNGRIAPLFAGTTDIYSYDQAILFGSGNKWNPRPVFQSYSAYTPQLLLINREHLTTQAAPDNIIFALQTIDGRLPAMEDGASWPVLLSSYSLTNSNKDYIHLSRRPLLSGKDEQVNSGEVLIYTAVHTMGEKINLPERQGLMIAKIKIRKTILGQMLNIFFKTSQLEITAVLKDGATRKFRIIPGMLETGFVISPLIENTSDFSKLFSGPRALEDKSINAIIIDTVESRWHWQDKYSISLSLLNY